MAHKNYVFPYKNYMYLFQIPNGKLEKKYKISRVKVMNNYYAKHKRCQSVKFKNLNLLHSNQIFIFNINTVQL